MAFRATAILLCLLGFACFGCDSASRAQPTEEVMPPREVKQKNHVSVNTPFDKDLIANAGEAMVQGEASKAFDVYAPLRPGQAMPMPKYVPANPVPEGVGWGAFYSLADGSLVIEAPRSFSSAGWHLGLRVDESGRVLGDHPWIDLDTKLVPEQPEWGDAPRDQFKRNGIFAKETTRFKLMFKGATKRSQGWVGEFVLLNAKGNGPFKPQTRAYLDAGDTFEFWWVGVTFSKMTSGRVRYKVKQVR